jgi:thiamine biosynthesis lipoprotein
VNEHRFRAMGTEIVVGATGAIPIHAVEAFFRERERTFSRFLADSELNRVNAYAGRIVEVSEAFSSALALALRLAEQTEGLVDPTIGAALEAAGYSRDFDLLSPDPDQAGEPQPGAWPSVLLFGRRVFAPASVRLDLNGVVKALTVDDALGLLRSDGFVSAGGDLAVRGELTVSLPDGDSVLLRRGALATSGTAKRRWLRAGMVQHHLIDPRIGRPSNSLWEQVTACGASCVAADAAAKAGFLLAEQGPDWLDSRGIPARFFRPDGAATANDTWRRSMQGAVACI